jgi:hypothetical protein
MHMSKLAAALLGGAGDAGIGGIYAKHVIYLDQKTRLEILTARISDAMK